MPGWVKIDREIRNHWIFENSEYLKGWITLIMAVNFEDKKVLIRSQLIECKRGQALYSLKTWVKILGNGWTLQKLRTFFKLLEKDSMIITKGLQKTTLITICNYDNYQECQHENNIQSTRKQHTNNIQTNLKQHQLKKEKNLKEFKNINREKTELIYPFKSDEFSNAWNLWKQYKFEQYKFTYKSTISEQAVLKKLMELSKNNEKTAIEIINQSISEQWKGLFELNNSKSENGKNNTGKEIILNIKDLSYQDIALENTKIKEGHVF